MVPECSNWTVVAWNFLPLPKFLHNIVDLVLPSNSGGGDRDGVTFFGGADVFCITSKLMSIAL